ncbi:MAG: transglycosylase SLT domain-containing protein [bacterium]
MAKRKRDRIRKRRRGRRILFLSLLAGAGALYLYFPAPPERPDDICHVFSERLDWYIQAKRSANRWGAPLHVKMAIMRHESGFRKHARTRWRFFLGIVPVGRISSAYGYAQAQDSTWDLYREKTGRTGASRNDFGDAVDFIGWYMDVSKRMLNLEPGNAYAHYLAYHEGQAGYKRGSHRKKAWLLKYAKRVAATSKRFEQQLSQCRTKLDRASWWRFWLHWV